MISIIKLNFNLLNFNLLIYDLLNFNWRVAGGYLCISNY
jgi:hypothetical protein